MKRAVKFRAWDKEKKRWTFGFRVDEMGYIVTKESIGGPLLSEVTYSPGNRYEVIQFTGLKDKNGVDIYEGDIVRVAWNPEAQPMWVEFQAPSFVMRFKTPSGSKSRSWSTFDLAPSENQSFEIIGNIYPNPDLLEADAA